MVNESNLRTLLIGILEHLKRQKDDAHLLMGLVAALRDSLDEISGGKFLPIFEKHYQQLDQNTKDVSDSLIARLDQTIQDLKDGKIL
jgi:hypothetical protein